MILVIISVIIVVIITTVVYMGFISPKPNIISEIIWRKDDTFPEEEVFYYSSGYPAHPYVYKSPTDINDELFNINQTHQFDWRLATKEELINAFHNLAEWDVAGIVSDHSTPLSVHQKDLPSIIEHPATTEFGAFLYGKKPHKNTDISTYILPFNPKKWSQSSSSSSSSEE